MNDTERAIRDRPPNITEVFTSVDLNQLLGSNATVPADDDYTIEQIYIQWITEKQAQAQQKTILVTQDTTNSSASNDTASANVTTDLKITCSEQQSE